MDNLILIDRDKIQIADGGKILTMAIPQTMVKDLEIVSKDLLVKEITSFLQKNQVNLGRTLILLSESVCFISEKSEGVLGKGNLLQDFVSTLPFENPAAIEISGRFVGTNRDLYDTIIDVLDNFGAVIKGVSPFFLAKELMGKRELTEEAVKLISDNEMSFTKVYFGFNAPVHLPTAAQPKQKVTPLSIRLGIVFGVLVVVLIVLLIFRK